MLLKGKSYKYLCLFYLEKLVKCLEAMDIDHFWEVTLSGKKKENDNKNLSLLFHYFMLALLPLAWIIKWIMNIVRVIHVGTYRWAVLIPVFLNLETGRH